ncbi:NUDIX hydrolase [Sphaerisporangium sp. TRM90804]|uniref:NUDIX hydrolase n=1 Tax=Sphaerisporangium sp. TRM90804 TaxID=3031113 RepID=UPI00244AAE3A|nr:NUDIX hydrolase [Sphaerisporangium sp. TRM90804]MDH2426663.1 NUDIX hydrolase [Sphaerisporangium sp. TRM90804]
MATIPTGDFLASLNKIVASAGAFITDPQGRVLLVKPNYRDHWGWPGGHVDAGETPEQACAREITEELGLTLPVGELLVVHWVPPFDDRPMPMVHFLFDCGGLPDGDGVILQEEELDDHAFYTPDEADAVMPPILTARLRAAVDARRRGAVRYLS